ncbi:MAG: DinB family protein [Anaerolineales bacterium]|nr:DinB family protein [Anaerolineales bacterium]
MAEMKLIEAVERFALVTSKLTDEELEIAWQWRTFDANVRFAFFQTYEDLRTLAAKLISQRTSGSKLITTAQRSLAQYHSAYRDLQAILLGADEELLDIPPEQDEWPLRATLGHIMAAEREFFARIWFAVQQHRQDAEQAEEATEMTSEEVEEFVGSYDDFERTMNRLSLAGILAFYDSLHKRVLREITDIRGLELEAPSLWWEGIPLSVEYRLHRLDSHLRQHTIQVEKTLEALTQPPSEALRLLRLIYAALADVEGVIVGDWLLGQREQQELAATIQQRAEEIEGIVEG